MGHLCHQLRPPINNAAGPPPWEPCLRERPRCRGAEAATLPLSLGRIDELLSLPRALEGRGAPVLERCEDRSLTTCSPERVTTARAGPDAPLGPRSPPLPPPRPPAGLAPPQRDGGPQMQRSSGEGRCPVGLPARLTTQRSPDCSHPQPPLRLGISGLRTQPAPDSSSGALRTTSDSPEETRLLLPSGRVRA